MQHARTQTRTHTHVGNNKHAKAGTCADQDSARAPNTAELIDSCTGGAVGGRAWPLRQLPEQGVDGADGTGHVLVCVVRVCVCVHLCVRVCVWV